MKRGTGKYKCKLPLKCFSRGNIGVVGIYPRLHAKAPTLDNVDHRVYLNNNNMKQNKNNNNL